MLNSSLPSCLNLLPSLLPLIVLGAHLDLILLQQIQQHIQLFQRRGDGARGQAVAQYAMLVQRQEIDASQTAAIFPLGHIVQRGDIR